MAAGSSILDSVYGSYTSGGANARFDALFDVAAAGSASPSGLGGGYSRYRYASSSSPYATTYSSSYQSRLAPLTLSSSSSYSPSYDKYYTYLDDLSTLRSSSGRAHSYRPSRYLESEFLDDTRSGYGLRGSGGGTISVGGYITNGPSHDRFGRELSNYDRWRMQNGGSFVRDDEPVRPSRRKFSSGRLLSKQSAGESESSSSDSGNNGSSNGGGNGFDAMEDLSRRTRETTVSSPISPLKSSDYNPFRESFVATSAVGTRGHSMAPAVQSSSSLRYQPSASNYRSAGYSSTSGFPAGVREKLGSYDVKDVRGDGGCYYRCLSLFFSGSEENYMRYRREVLAYIKENLENYSTMIRSETASTNDYFSRKMRSDRQDWAETTEIIATCCVYNINVHVLAIVPGRGSRASWEWLHFDPSIGTGKASYASRDIFLYNQGSVHFMLCTPRR